ncbi:ATP-grasp domain-containing protein [Micromonospora echinospora]
MSLSDVPQVVLASCAAMPEGDGDEAELVDLLARRGVSAVWRPWGGAVGPETLVVLRATWDYPERPAAFHRWCASVPRLANPAELVRYNADKRYLLDLQAAGVATIPTTVVERGDPVEAASELIAGSAEYVVKPVVGAGSRGAGRFGPGLADQARHLIHTLHEQGLAVLVQPYQEAVDSEGEQALVFLAGRYSHAFHKGPMLAGGAVDTAGALYLAERLAATEPDQATISLAEQALAATARRCGAVAEHPLYARVDVVRGTAGPLVLEVELIEPSLGFRYGDPGALARFADAIAARVDGSDRAAGGKESASGGSAGTLDTAPVA